MASQDHYHNAQSSNDWDTAKPLFDLTGMMQEIIVYNKRPIEQQQHVKRSSTRSNGNSNNESRSQSNSIDNQSISSLSDDFCTMKKEDNTAGIISLIETVPEQNIITSAGKMLKVYSSTENGTSQISKIPPKDECERRGRFFIWPAQEMKSTNANEVIRNAQLLQQEVAESLKQKSFDNVATKK